MHFLALLSHDNVIQYWDYLSRKVVATTRALAENILININKYKRPTKRLAFSPDGSQLALALKNKWSVIDVPNNNNNLLMIYYLLHTNQIPNEVINAIIQSIVTLSKITPISPLQYTELYQQQKTECRDIEIIYSSEN